MRNIIAMGATVLALSLGAASAQATPAHPADSPYILNGPEGAPAGTYPQTLSEGRAAYVGDRYAYPADEGYGFLLVARPAGVNSSLPLADQTITNRRSAIDPMNHPVYNNNH
jgi:hypothetical protein